MIENMDLLFNPSSVAIIGASKYEKSGGGILLKSILEGNYQGKVFPINKRESEIKGLKVYPSILDVPHEVDVALVAVPASGSIEVLNQCKEKGVRFAIVHTSGFGELGDGGKELEKQLVKIARSGGPRIIGPNCMGVFSPGSRFNTAIPFVTPEFESGSISFVGQSGWATENTILHGHERGLHFNKVVSIGNQSDIGIEDLLEYFAFDHDTKVIGCYVEGLRRPKEFVKLAAEISRLKPVVVWKGGKSNQGVAAVRSHTGSLAGNNMVFEAAMKSAGVISVRNIDELTDTLVAMSGPLLPAGNRVGMLSSGGAASVACADACETAGLELPRLSVEAQQEMKKILLPVAPALPDTANPVDVGWIQ
ncbi:MAG: CoA-binding protein, partial [Dehalococcoidia bacterium]|nr:CoA-binding protein [Dehalococcoidia bacterium]